ncbi:lytic polysaccharide monooxygenase [Xylariaceae sp. AK1471]|nr:lytic polysaccharide monooxygenase [Xylariaceae sp. AK1471]
MPSMTRSALLAAIAGAATVSAHGHVTQVSVDGVSYIGFDPTSAPYAKQPDSIVWSNGATDNGFVLSSAVQDPDIICHLDATNGVLTAPAAAGGKVSITWNTWPESHKGPVIDYLADCGGDCATVDKTTLKFFKIAEMGQLELGSGSGSTGKFADDLLFDTGFTWTSTIPASIKPGNYVWRHELIALHEGGTEGKAQMYPQCFNLKITGSGTQSPSGVVGTKLYTSTDPGILHNIYNDENMSSPADYIIPGPAMPVFDGSNSNTGSGSSNQAPTTTSSAVASSSAAATTAVPTTSVAATSAVITSVAAVPNTSSPAETSAVITSTQVASTPVVSAPAATPKPTFHCGGKKKRHHARQLKHLQ